MSEPLFVYRHRPAWRFRLRAKLRGKWRRLVCFFRDHKWEVAATVTGLREEKDATIISAVADIRCERCEKKGGVNVLKKKRGVIRLESLAGSTPVPIPGETR